MALVFDPKTGVTVEDTAVVRKRIASDWKKAFNVSEGSPELVTDPETPAGQLIDGQTALVSQKDNDLLGLANGFNPKTATGVFQDALAQIYFLQRQVAQPTYVTCQCRGLYGTVIPYGAVVQDVNGNTFYNTTAAVIPSEGIVECVFRCSVYGAVEVGVKAVNTIITVIPGWDTVSNNAAGATGRDVETQSEFETRRYESVSKNAHGTAESVEGTVANLSGVIACACEQNRGDVSIVRKGVTIPPHSIYLSVYGGDPKQIGMAIHMKLGGGCGFAGNTKVTIKDPTVGSNHDYFYEIPETVPFGIKISMVKTPQISATFEDDIRSALVKNFEGQEAEHGRVKMGQTVYASRFYKSVILAGVENLQTIKIKFPAASGTYSDKLEIPLDKLPTLAKENIEIEVIS